MGWYINNVITGYGFVRDWGRDRVWTSQST